MRVPNINIDAFAKKMDPKGAFGSVLAIIAAVLVICGGTAGVVIGTLLLIPIYILALGMFLEHLPFSILKGLGERSKSLANERTKGASQKIDTKPRRSRSTT